MKGTFLLSLLTISYTISAQLTITPGAQFSITGNAQLTLHNTNFINNGSFTAGNGVTEFTGNESSLISGSQPIQFFGLGVNKTNSTSVILQRTIGVSNRILFSSGFLNLNGFNADLGSTARLENEKETSRVTGANGGQVLFSTLLNAPLAENPGNLGAVFTSSQNLGNVIIKRGHQSQAGVGLGNSILRYYDITPANNSNLNATLQVNYFDAELNAIDENSLVFFKSNDGINWSNQGFNSRNATTNAVVQTGISSFSRWTLSSNNSPLPVSFILFNAKCEGGKVLITWKTAQEQNSSHFDIERSADGAWWTTIGNLPAAGNSTTETSYSFTDNNPLQNGFYRIAEYDLDGRVQYTSILRSSCDARDIFSLWPNPVRDLVFINIVTNSQSPVIMKLFDSKGALVKVQKATVLPGSNQLSMDMQSLANGAYSLSVFWNDGQTKKTVQVLKQ